MEKIHFGCFNCPLPGWKNTDVTPHIFIARIPGLAFVLHKAGAMTDTRYDEHRRKVFNQVHYLDVAKPWNQASDSLQAVYSSHVFEHLTLAAARNCLKEAFRCLKKGGVLRLSVPDLDLMVKHYEASDAMQWATALFEATEKREKNMHHFMYNFISLEQLLRSQGFSQVVRRAYREGDCPDVELLDNRPDSLFVEAIK